MMDGIIGTVPNIVGVDMTLNQNGRRQIVKDEYDLFQTDLSTVPVAFAKNIVPIAYAEEK